MAVQVELLLSQRAGRSEAAESYQVSVARAPGRGWGGPLHAAGLDGLQGAAIRRDYAGYLQRQQSGAWQEASPHELAPLRAVGSQLFAALPETVQARLHRVLALAHARGEQLALTLTFEPSAQALLTLPWELLHSPQSNSFFALQGSLTRRAALAAGYAIETGRPQAILGVWAEPRGLSPLDERRRWAPSPTAGSPAEMAWVQGAGTMEKLARALDEGAFDALHVVAHGRGGPAFQDFALAFEGERGEPRWLSSEQLAVFLGGYSRLRFVYLDVCAAGHSMADDYTPGGLALALLQAGVPQVMVMQEDMAQGAAGLLAQSFYAALQGGGTAAQALSAGRRAVRVQLDDPVHWSVPALYTAQEIRAPAEALPAVDAFLDALGPQHVYTFLALAALFVLIAHLSYQFATASLQDRSAVALLLAQSAALPLLGAFLGRGGAARPAAQHRPDRRARLWLALDSCFSAGVWAGMAWLVVIILLAGLTLGQIWGRLGLDARQFIWALLLGLVALAGYTGARQSWRQASLFLREGPARRSWTEWPVTLALLFMPLLIYFLLLQLMGLWGVN